MHTVVTYVPYTLTHTHRFAFAKFMQNDAAIFVSDRCFGLCTRKEAYNVSRNRVSIVPTCIAYIKQQLHGIALRIFIVQRREARRCFVCASIRLS